ncbi:hypothetical protein AK812_SmicGene16011 [Symbiodinium microadriaticum]|uniref:Uncharacterized protein n=1 Tax=Symbiodinium microadriaticum TaxID=2951 RepID=A0A1Q9E1F3_SYMMI|nr:hypothetical protein AK812_SmicGene16011 [Symbiodinium microadriaticum]
MRAMPVGLCVAAIWGVDVSAGENGMEGRLPCSLPTHWCVEGLQIQSGEYCTAYCPAGSAKVVVTVSG